MVFATRLRPIPYPRNPAILESAANSRYRFRRQIEPTTYIRPTHALRTHQYDANSSGEPRRRGWTGNDRPQFTFFGRRQLQHFARHTSCTVRIRKTLMLFRRRCTSYTLHETGELQAWSRQSRSGDDESQQTSRRSTAPRERLGYEWLQLPLEGDAEGDDVIVGAVELGADDRVVADLSIKPWGPAEGAR